MGELRATAVTEVHVIVPEGIDDPARPSGGNTYDRRVCRGLAALGWAVHEHAVIGAADLARVVARIPDGAVVLLDGLIASPAPDVLVPRRRGGCARSCSCTCRSATGRARGLAAAAAVVTTSEWTRRRLIELYGLPPTACTWPSPASTRPSSRPGSAAGDALLCVAAVTRGKGHDVLLDGLSTVTDLSWRCECVGSLDRRRGLRRPRAAPRAATG